MTPTATLSPAETLTRFRDAVEVLSALPAEASVFRMMAEAELLEATQLFARAHRLVNNEIALAAGEFDHRSGPALGSEGLAQKLGHRTTELFIRHTTGATSRDAVTAVRVGKLMREAALAGEVDLISGEVAVVSQPWLAPVTAALADRAISVEAAEAIRAGLGEPNSAITVDQLTDAAAQLVEAAQTLDPDSLRHEAHVFRDLLDLDGAALRAEERRQKRSLRLFVQPDGTTKLVWVMDTETAAVIRNLYDRSTSPKLHGPRFADASEQAASDAIERDERTTEQLASDAFEQLLKLGADANPNFLLGSGAPIIKLTATADSVQVGKGLVRVEGQPGPLTIRDLERLTCGGTTSEVTIGPDGYALNFGREQRLFSRQQKESLAITWGGCALNGCARPPSWTEAHHIVQWKRDGGKTDLRDGILLCKHHHLLSHNLKWEIFRDADGRYWLSKPGPDGSVITELRKKGLALRDLQRQQTAENQASP